MTTAVIAVVYLTAAAAGLLPPRVGIPLVTGLAVLLAVAAGRVSVAALLSPVCAYLVVALGRAVVRERAARRQLTATYAAARVAETNEAVLKERTRIAGDIHDVVAHSVSALLVQLTAARALLDDDPADLSRVRGMLDRGVEVARAAMHETQTVVTALRGGGPDWTQVRQLIADFAATTGIVCDVVMPEPAPTLDRDVALTLYRTVQEALTNTARHAAAERVDIEITVRDAHLVASVRDVSGDRPAPVHDLPSGGQGLNGLRDRATAVGGHLTASPTSTGFLVQLALPVNA